jgi:hypothetical protein
VFRGGDYNLDDYRGVVVMVVQTTMPSRFSPDHRLYSMPLLNSFMSHVAGICQCVVTHRVIVQQ